SPGDDPGDVDRYNQDLARYVESQSVEGMTLAPAVPVTATPDAVLANLINHVVQARALGWISNDAIARSLRAKLESAHSALSLPPSFPRPNATKLVETDRIVVWDIVWPKEQPSPLHRHVFDQVGTYYQSGGRAITSLNGARSEATTPVGNISTTRKGTTHVEE